MTKSEINEKVETEQQPSSEYYDELSYPEGSYCRHNIPLPTTPEPQTYVITEDSPKDGSRNTPRSELRKLKLDLLRSNRMNKSYSALANRNMELKVDIELLREELARSEKSVKTLIQHLRHAQQKWIFYHKLYVKEEAKNNHPGCPDFSYLADEQV
ncbi:hypothetical protein DFP73DRAFT_528170 [Morchella snyderi]|nr:hypothetical protein DFP73DRAFT_528170 [Morchella snyderi]